MTREVKVPHSISDDAKMVLGSFFGMGLVTALNFQMKESKPASRTQAALDELVAEGLLDVETINGAGGRGYKSLLTPEDNRKYLSWMRANSKRADMRWDITVPL